MLVSGVTTNLVNGHGPNCPYGISISTLGPGPVTTLFTLPTLSCTDPVIFSGTRYSPLAFVKARYFFPFAVTTTSWPPTGLRERLVNIPLNSIGPVTGAKTNVL